nr:inositol 1,4,5-triphosphate receptor associated 2 isoform X2 [Misgurnus anguillicaudatus]
MRLYSTVSSGELEITVNIMACVNQHTLGNNRTENCDSDSDEGCRQYNQMALEKLSVIERLGPNSVDMTEEELEAAFSELSLSFRCDQYTLCQRLEAEEHARNKAESNIKLEVERGMEMLQTLKGMCVDTKRVSLLQQIELCLSIIGNTIGRISNTAEVLGAVHQEVKSSRAVELMVAHVQNLKRRHERNSTELEEMKKQIESSRERQACEQREETEAMEKDSHKIACLRSHSQSQLRRRISVSIISKQSQRHKSLESQASILLTNEKGEERESITNKQDQANASLLEDRRQGLYPKDSPSQTADADTPEMSSTASAQTPPKQRNEMDTAHFKKQRRKSVLQCSSDWLKRSVHYLRNCDRFVMSLQRPLLQWLYHCRWIILVVYLTVLCSILILAIFVWILQMPILWM